MHNAAHRIAPSDLPLVRFLRSCLHHVLPLAAAAILPLSTLAQISVSSSGTPTYSHPVATPPGIAGMRPQLSIAYGGGGINGPLGLGWSLQGISMITRCPATLFSDAAPRGVRFDQHDKLCLDGQRLIQTDANGVVTPAAEYDGTGKLLRFPQTHDARGLSSGYREYRTEKDTFVRVRAYGVANGAEANGPAYFKVWTKAGQQYIYGAAPGLPANANASIKASAGNVVMVWAASRISDSVGNYMDFKYEVQDVLWGSGFLELPEPGAPPVTNVPTLGREWNIQEIQYTGNGAQVPSNKVVFVYEDRPRVPDKAEAYQLGSKNVSTRRMKAIETYVNSPNPDSLGPGAQAVMVKRLKLAYDDNAPSKRSRLITISDCVGTTEAERCMPPTTLQYADGGADAFEPKTAFNLQTTKLRDNVGDRGVEVADFNVDGRSDILAWSKNPAETRMYLSRGDGTFDTMPLGSGPGQFGITGSNEVLNSASGCQASLVMDFNADGIPDIFRYNSSGNEGLSCGTQPTYLYLGRGDGGFDRRSVTGVTLVKNKAVTVCPITQDPCDLPQADTFYVMDVNGDGYLDIVKTWIPVRRSDATADPCNGTVTCTEIYRGNGTGVFTLQSPAPTTVSRKSLFQWPSDVGSRALSQQRYVYDVDGDGLADIVLGQKAQGTAGFVAWRSLGTGDFETYSTRIESEDCEYPIDFNGDGRTECVWPDGTTSLKNRLSVTTGHELYFVHTFNLTNVALKGNNVGTRVVDFNGDGRGDILRWGSLGGLNQLYLSLGDGSFVQSQTFNLNTADRRLVTSNGVFDFATGDFLGNGSVSVLRMKHNPTAGDVDSNQLYVKTDPTPPDQLQSIVSPTGIKTSLIYAPLASAPGVTDDRLKTYLSDRGLAGQSAVYPQIDLASGAPVVVAVDTDSGVGDSRLRTEYAYRGLKAAVDGRGLLGFRRTAQQTTAPNGEPLSVWTDFLLEDPYAGVARQTETRRGPWTEPDAPLLSTTVNTYCDKTSAASPPDTNTTGVGDAFSASAPCATNARLRRPYLRRVVEQGTDLDGAPLPTVTTVNTYNQFGDPLNVLVTTRSTVAGIADQVFTKNTASEFCNPGSTLPGGGACPNVTAGDLWILGRLTRATVTSTVPNLFDQVQAGPGTAPHATDVAGGLTVTVPDSVEFGDVDVDASALQTMTVSNGSGVSLAITAPVLGDVSGQGFSLQGSDCSGVLARSQSCTITVRFAPVVRGSASGTIMVRSTAGAKPVTLNGVGRRAELTIEPSSALTFDPVQAGQTGTPVSMTLRNIGNKDADALVFTAPQGFTVNRTGCPATLAASAPCTFTVAFAPPSANTYSGQVEVDANAPILKATRSVQGTSQPQVAQIDGPPGFGLRELGSSVDGTVVLRNQGLGPLTLTPPGASAVTGAGFSFKSTNCANPLPTGGTCNIVVTFTPQAVGPLNGSVTVSTGAGPKTATLTGEGTRAELELLPPGVHDFGTLQTGETSTEATWTVQNKGTAPARNIAFVAPAAFELDKHTCAAVPLNLDPQATCDIRLTFKPTVAGTLDGDLQVTVDAPGLPTVKALKGIGQNPSASLTGWDFGGVPVGSSPLAQAKLKNTGVGPLSVANPAADIWINEPGTSDDGAFAINNPGCAATLQPQEECGISLRFTPGNNVPTQATLKVRTNAGVKQATIKGYGLQEILDVGTTAAPNFGSVEAGTTSPTRITFSVHNPGNVQTQVLSIEKPNGYLIDQDNCTGHTLPANETQGCTFRLGFSPQTEGTFNGDVVVRSGSVEDRVAVTGTGVASPPVLTTTPAANLEMGSIVRVGSGTGYFTLFNTGGALQNLAIVVSTPNGQPASFSLSTGTQACAVGTTLAKDASCRIHIRADASCTSGTALGQLAVSGSNSSGIYRTMTVTVSDEQDCP